MSDTMIDGDALARCPDCFHTINLSGLNDPDCPCYCHKAVDEMQEWLMEIEERRDWHSRPLLLVDVDGVLNSFAWEWDRQPSFDDEVLDDRLEDLFDAEGYGIYVPKGTKQRMQRLEALYECVWATTWEHKAPEFLSPHLGFGANWPVVEGFKGRFKSYGATWKLPAVQNWVEKNAGDRKVAWLDDDLNSDAFNWAHERGDDKTLLVLTNGITGWSDEDAKRLEDWARG